jgi:NAD(P)-dependent dehydrogenase (short-subunit alcohol dehydrogenase family)
VASKAAVVAFTEVAAAELRDSGITVNAIAPGPVPTAFMREVLAVGPDVAGPELYATAADQSPPELASLRELLEYVVSESSGWLSGRLLSARWDRPAALERERAAVEAGSRYRVRRIDEDLYHEMSRP